MSDISAQQASQRFVVVAFIWMLTDTTLVMCKLRIYTCVVKLCAGFHGLYHELNVLVEFLCWSCLMCSGCIWMSTGFILQLFIQFMSDLHSILHVMNSESVSIEALLCQRGANKLSVTARYVGEA